MICAPVLGVLIALAADRLLATSDRVNQVVGLAAVAVALLPVLPTPYPVRERSEVPAFITQGMYRSYLSKGESVVTVPLPHPGSAEALHWQSATGLGFRVAGGYFNGPWGPDRDRHLRRDAPAHLQPLQRCARHGRVPEIGAELAGAGAVRPGGVAGGRGGAGAAVQRRGAVCDGGETARASRASGWAACGYGMWVRV